MLAFADANARWEPDALRRLVRHLADPEVGYVCGRLQLQDSDGATTSKALYWRFELWLREAESACGSITAGNGAIYAVRRSAYLTLGPERSHDLGFPFPPSTARPARLSTIRPRSLVNDLCPKTKDEWPRKVRMLSRAWGEILTGGMLDPQGQPTGYFGALLSHRLLRYASGPLHLVLFVT